MLFAVILVLIEYLDHKVNFIQYFLNSLIVRINIVEQNYSLFLAFRYNSPSICLPTQAFFLVDYTSTPTGFHPAYLALSETELRTMDGLYFYPRI